MEKLSIIIVILFNCIFCSISLNGQVFGHDYKEVIENAMDAYNAKDYKKAGPLFDEAIAMKNGISPYPSIYFPGFQTWLELGDTLKAFQYLNKLGTSIWIDIEQLKTNVKPEISNHPTWKAFENNMIKEQAKYFEVKNQLEYLNTKDQALRRLFPCAEEQFKEDALAMNYYLQLIKEEDRENLEMVKKIIAEHGWLGKNKVGLKGNNVLWQVIQHSTAEERIRYLPLLQKSVERGETLPHKLGYLEDRIKTDNGQSQIYGSQYMQLEDGNFLLPVENFEQINTRRKQIGLGPIEEYMEHLGIAPYNHKQSLDLADKQRRSKRQ